MTTPRTAAQQAQLDNRRSNGQFDTKKHSEAEVSLGSTLQADKPQFAVDGQDLDRIARLSDDADRQAQLIALTHGLSASGWPRVERDEELDGELCTPSGVSLSSDHFERAEHRGEVYWGCDYSQPPLSRHEDDGFSVQWSTSGGFVDDTEIDADTARWMRASGDCTDTFTEDLFDGDPEGGRRMFEAMEYDYQRLRQTIEADESVYYGSERGIERVDLDFSGAGFHAVADDERIPAGAASDTQQVQFEGKDYLVDGEAVYEASQRLTEDLAAGEQVQVSFASGPMAQAALSSAQESGVLEEAWMERDEKSRCFTVTAVGAESEDHSPRSLGW